MHGTSLDREGGGPRRVCSPPGGGKGRQSQTHRVCSRGCPPEVTGPAQVLTHMDHTRLPLLPLPGGKGSAQEASEKGLQP